MSMFVCGHELSAALFLSGKGKHEISQGIDHLGFWVTDQHRVSGLPRDE